VCSSCCPEEERDTNDRSSFVNCQSCFVLLFFLTGRHHLFWCRDSIYVISGVYMHLTENMNVDVETLNVHGGHFAATGAVQWQGQTTRQNRQNIRATPESENDACTVYEPCRHETTVILVPWPHSGAPYASSLLHAVYICFENRYSECLPLSAFLFSTPFTAHRSCGRSYEKKTPQNGSPWLFPGLFKFEGCT